MAFRTHHYQGPTVMRALLYFGLLLVGLANSAGQLHANAAMPPKSTSEYSFEPLPDLAVQGRPLAPVTVLKDDSIMLMLTGGSSDKFYRWDGRNLTTYFTGAPGFVNLRLLFQSTDGYIFFFADPNSGDSKLLAISVDPSARTAIDVLAGTGIRVASNTYLLSGATRNRFIISDDKGVHLVQNGAVTAITQQVTYALPSPYGIANVFSLAGHLVYLIHKSYVSGSPLEWWKVYAPVSWQFSVSDAIHPPSTDELYVPSVLQYWGDTLVFGALCFYPNQWGPHPAPKKAVHVDLVRILVDGTQTKIFSFNGLPSDARLVVLGGDKYIGYSTIVDKNAQNQIIETLSITDGGTDTYTLLRSFDALGKIGLVAQIEFPWPIQIGKVAEDGSFIFQGIGFSSGSFSYFVARPTTQK
jgi:hypothetical protein